MSGTDRIEALMEVSLKPKIGMTMIVDEKERQDYFVLLEKKLDAYFQAVIDDSPVEELNAELKGYLEAGMVMKITSKDVLDAMIQTRYQSIRNKQQADDSASV